MDMVISEGKNISDSTTEAYTDMHSPDLILSDKHELSHIKGRTILKNNTNDKALSCLKDIIAISEPVPVKSIDYMDETPFSTVEDMVDREPEDGDVWTKIEYIRDKEENNQDGISVSVNHRYGDKHICLPMNTPSYKHISPALCALAGVVTKEEDIGPVEMVVSERGIC